MPDVEPIPDNYPRMSPYLCVRDAAAAIRFYADVFGAKERLRIPMPDGKIGHAELEIGDSLIMLADEFPEMGISGPGPEGAPGVWLSVYVRDVDATYALALEAGARSTQAPADQFYGDRSAQFVDPFGHRWGIAMQIERLTPEQIAERSKGHK